MPQRAGTKPPLWVVVGFYGALAMIGLVWDAFLEKEPGVVLARPDTLWRDAAIGTAAGLLVVGLSRVLEARWAPARELALELRRSLGELTSFDVLIYALTSSVAEEIFFRGAMQTAIGWVATSVIFGFVHGGFAGRLWFWSVFALLMGFWLGWAALWTGSLLAPILTHFVTNLLNLRALSRMKVAVAT